VKIINREILGIALAFLMGAMLTAPVLAIGPQNAEKSENPNIQFTGYSVQIFSPSGVMNEWIIVDPSHVQIKPAKDFHIGNAHVPSSANEILYNKWNLLSEDVFMEFLITIAGFDSGVAYYVSHVVLAGGVYYKEVYAGQ
jgi:hypothetical protein